MDEPLRLHWPPAASVLRTQAQRYLPLSLDLISLDPVTVILLREKKGAPLVLTPHSVTDAHLCDVRWRRICLS